MATSMPHNISAIWLGPELAESPNKDTLSTISPMRSAQGSSASRKDGVGRCSVSMDLCLFAGYYSAKQAGIETLKIHNRVLFCPLKISIVKGGET